MKWLAIALICAVGIIGVETYLLMEPLPPPLPLRTIVITPPAPPQPIMKRKVVARKSQPARVTTANPRPFVMPTGGIFSGADPQDPRIYHFNAE